MNDRRETELWFYRFVFFTAAVFAIVHFYGRRIDSWIYSGWFAPIGLVPAAVVGLLLLAKLPSRWGRWVALVAAGALHLFLVVPRLRPDERGWQPPCVSNLKQIASASFYYLEDYDWRLPSAGQRWSEALLPYVRNQKLFQCPQAWAEHRPTADERQALPLTYGLNPYLVGHDLRSTPHPEQVIVFYCGDDAGPVMRHAEGTYFSYLDGHVKWVKAGTHPGVWNPWEPTP